MEVDLVLLAMGFLGPERNGMLSQLGVKLTERGNNPYLTGRSDLPAPPSLERQGGLALAFEFSSPPRGRGLR